jgi:predicted metal-dependent HD superfamily phosphohydrolase
VVVGQDGPVDELLQPWVDALGAGDDVLRAGRELLARYGEPHRRYHDALHLSEVLAALRALCAGSAVPTTVLQAAYWHDAVYEPVRSDNERRSADLAATTLLRLRVPPAQVDEVVRLVALTATHDPAPDDGHGALLCDADLAVLAAPADRYRAYAAGVRQEYAHLDDGAFRRGRAAVLRGLTDRERLFRTEAGRHRWEQAARRNVQDELARLAAPLP